MYGKNFSIRGVNESLYDLPAITPSCMGTVIVMQKESINITESKGEFKLNAMAIAAYNIPQGSKEAASPKVKLLPLK